MRITFNSQYTNVVDGMNGASERLSEFQRQVATGKRIEQPSDDPTAMASLVGERDQLASVDRYSRSADSVSARLSVVDSVLSDVIEKLTSAQTTVTGARNSTNTAAQREAAAQSLLSLRDSLID